VPPDTDRWVKVTSTTTSPTLRAELPARVTALGALRRSRAAQRVSRHNGRAWSGRSVTLAVARRAHNGADLADRLFSPTLALRP
jgi:hypothetical protein